MGTLSTWRKGLVVVVAAAAIVGGLGTDGRSGSTASAALAPAVMVGAGDIATCDSTTSADTAALVRQISGTVFTLGDNVQGDGTLSEFRSCYRSTWGQFKFRTRPAAGNHEYLQPGAAPYFTYFGAAAGEPGKGYYSYDKGAWHVVVLNSNCDYVACGAASAQNAWLQADLAAHPRLCTVAYMHRPRFSVGFFGDQAVVKPLWDTLYANGVEMVLSGHDHIYSRFRPMRPDGSLDATKGIVQIVAGTGGFANGKAERVNPNLVTKNVTTHGVVSLTLYPSGVAERYISTDGSYSDATFLKCH